MAGLAKRNFGPTSGRRRRRKRIVISVLVLGVVAAVVLVVVAAIVPTGNNSTQATPTTAPEPALIVPKPAISDLQPTAPAPSANGLAAVMNPLAANPDLGSFSGSIADADTGTVLWSTNPNNAMTPASTTKVLTATAALLALPADHRVTTSVVKGEQPGQLVLIAGGDPTLTAQPTGQPSFYPGSARIDDLVGQIKRAGIDTTSLVIDTSVYSGPTLAQGWFAADIAGGDIAPIEPIMLDGGRSNPLVDESPRSATPALDAGRAIASALGIDASKVSFGRAPTGTDPVASVQSAPLRDRLAQMMSNSDNVLAEAVGREIAIAANTDASFAGADAAIGQTLFDAKFDQSGVTLHDASGLSVDDRIPARLLDAAMAAAAGDGNEKLRPMLDYLPVAGATGTLSDRYAAANRGGAGWVRAKTGTLATASALAGYVVDVEGRVLTFALMSNDRPPELSRPALDAMASALRACGCS